MSSSVNRNSAVKRRLRETLYVRFHGRCAYCATPTNLREGTIDHYVPRVAGGVSAQTNLKWSCRDCNKRKDDMPPEEWEKWVSILRVVKERLSLERRNET